MTPLSRRHRSTGFTLVEMLVSFVVMLILLLVVSAMVNRTSTIWTYTRGKIEQFREARDAFDLLTRHISEATLNTYYDYEDDQQRTRTEATRATFVPRTYARQSELRFLSGPALHGESHAIFFQAPMGRVDSNVDNRSGSALNTIGFFIEYGDDKAFLPPFAKERTRFRLMEFIEPSDKLTLYTYTSGAASGADRLSDKWFKTPLSATPAPVNIAAENIIALALLPKLSPADQAAGNQAGGNYTDTSLAPNYTYDSTKRESDPRLNPRNQLPVLVQVTMIAIDEASALRIGDIGLQGIRNELKDRFINASKYADDLKDMEGYLAENHIAYQVFSSNIALKNAKWSRNQIK